MKFKKTFSWIAPFSIILALAYLYSNRNTVHKQKILAPDISFLIADMRWNNGTLKILELGNGPDSYFQGFDDLFGIGSIWQSWWHYLRQFNLPIWYIGNKPSPKNLNKRFAFDDFLANGGNWAPSLEALEHTEQFKKILTKPLHKKNLHQISQYRGILIFCNHGYAHWHTKSLARFQKNHSGFLVVNHASTQHVSNKYRTSLLFGNRLKPYRPAWIRCLKQYSPTLAKTIIKSLDAQNVVIKPLNAANGHGNLMVSAETLDATLKKILIQPKLLTTNKDPAWSHWANDKNQHFLVEEFVTSHAISINGVDFDGTMRAVFVLKYEEEEINITFLGHVWKLPQLALGQKGNLMEKHRSGFGSAKVAMNDIRGVEVELKKLLPKLYKKMIEQML